MILADSGTMVMEMSKPRASGDDPAATYYSPQEPT